MGKVIRCYKSNKDASIIFTDYYEIVGDMKFKKSKELFKKRVCIWPLKYKLFNKMKYFKRFSLKYHKARPLLKSCVYTDT